MSFFEELRRRNVLRAAAAYVALAWLVIQVVETLFPLFGLSDAAARAVVIVLAVGFVPAVIAAWAFELTPQGFRREAEVDHDSPAIRSNTRRLDRMIMVLLALGLAYFALDKFVISPQRQAELIATTAEEARREGRTEAIVGSYGDNSIAVLPFVNMSADPEQEYFADGISEELLNLLARIPELRVISRSSAFAFKGKDIEIPVIAERLNVAHILEGSVRKAGNRVRITAQLIEARSDTHLWSETYDRTLDDIFAIQTEIAEAIAEQMKVSLGLEEGERLVAVTGDLTAYDLYLQGRARMRERGPGVEEAIGLFEAAVARDSNYAPAWASLAESYTLKPHHQAQFPDSAAWANAFVAAESAARQALALDPGNASARVALGSIRRDSRDWDAAAEQFERALALDPDNAEALHQHAEYLYGLGRIADGLEVAERSLALDPLTTIRHAIVAWGHLLDDDCDAAIAMAERGLELDPDMSNLVAAALTCEMYEGDDDAAESRILRRFSPTADDSAFARSMFDAVRAGDPSRLPDGFEEIPSPGVLLIALGDTAAAVADAREFLFDPPYGVPYYIWEPFWDPMRGDPWYREVMRRMDLEGRVPIRTEP